MSMAEIDVSAAVESAFESFGGVPSRLSAAWKSLQSDNLELATEAVSRFLNASRRSGEGEASAENLMALRENLLEILVDSEREPWDLLFRECSTEEGKRISKADRARIQAAKMPSTNLVYGEISFNSLGIVLFEFVFRQEIPPPKVFYDLGSGTGRGVFAAAVLGDFCLRKIVGIEVLHGLHEAANKVLKAYKKMFPKSDKEIVLHRSDFNLVDWSDGDVVFANSTCFSDKLMDCIGRLGGKLKQGAILITLTKPVESPYFQITASRQYKMSWGSATVYIHRRNSV